MLRQAVTQMHREEEAGIDHPKEKRMQSSSLEPVGFELFHRMGFGYLHGWW